jgi:hypothetical protein
MTSEMRAASERGADQSDFDLIRRNAAAGVAPAEDEDTPDASALMRATLNKRRAGRPMGSGNKEQVSVRF